MKKSLLVIAFIFSLASLWAQDPHYSQYNETPVYVNPALCGTAYDVRVIANYRNQWQSVSVPYTTYGLSGEFAIKHKKTRKAYLTTGLIAYEDIAGSGNMSQLHIGGILGVVVNTGKNSKLSFGATGSFDQRRVNTGKFQWENQYNGYQYDPTIPGETVPNNQINYADFGVGVDYHFAKSERYISSNDGSRVDIGFAAYHLNSPLTSYYDTGEQQYMKYVQHASFTIALPNIRGNIIPSYILMMQGPSVEINAGIMFQFIIAEASIRSNNVKGKALSIGGYYRSRDAFIPQFLFEYGKYAFGAAYDLNLSTLTPYSHTSGALEVVLRYNFNPGYGLSVGNSTTPKPTPYFK